MILLLPVGILILKYMDTGIDTSRYTGVMIPVDTPILILTLKMMLIYWYLY